MSAHPLGTVRVMAQERGAGRAKPAAEVPEEYRAIFEAVTDGVLITDPATGEVAAGRTAPSSARRRASGFCIRQATTAP